MGFRLNLRWAPSARPTISSHSSSLPASYSRELFVLIFTVSCVLSFDFIYVVGFFLSLDCCSYTALIFKFMMKFW